MSTLENTTEETISFARQIFSKGVVKILQEKKFFSAIIRKNNLYYFLIDYETPPATNIEDLEAYGKYLFWKLYSLPPKYLN